MRLAGSPPCAFFLLVVACGTTTTTRPTPPAPEPAIPTPTPGNAPARTWSFNYEPGTSSYEISRTATVESQSDSAPAKELTTNVTHESLMLERVGDTIQFAMIADTFATTTQGLLGPAQSAPLPVRISGSLTREGLQLDVDTAAERCNPAQSALKSDLHNLVVPFPEQLTRGMTWRDSVELSGCQGLVPTTAHIIRVYSVTGEAVTADRNAVLVIERKDTIEAHGEGAQQQHQVVIDASGSGTALEYLDTSTGRIVRVTANQDLTLGITTSGRIHRFKQSLKQEFVIGR